MRTFSKYFLFFVSIFIIYPSITTAGIFCVSSTDELNLALYTAGRNNEHNVIKIVQGEYVGPFYYHSAVYQNLTLEGGYLPGCGTREVDAKNTVLLTYGGDPAIYISAAGTLSSIRAEGLTFTNNIVLFRSEGNNSITKCQFIGSGLNAEGNGG